jgi:hypothetical protein
MLNLYAHDLSLGIKLFGLSIHPQGAVNKDIMPLKLDKDGIFVLDAGITLGIERFLYKDWVSVKFVQGFYLDCLTQPAGFSHIGIRGKIFQIGKHSLNGGIGPTFIYRKNWYNVAGYKDDFSFFNGSPGDYLQWRFLWYGGEFEYNYKLNESIDLSASFIPGFPDIAVFSSGIRYRN